jgi:hypothetical protein
MDGGRYGEVVVAITSAMDLHFVRLKQYYVSKSGHEEEASSPNEELKTHTLLSSHYSAYIGNGVCWIHCQLQEKILTKPNFYPFPVFRLFSLF